MIQAHRDEDSSLTDAEVKAISHFAAGRIMMKDRGVQRGACLCSKQRQYEALRVLPLARLHSISLFSRGVPLVFVAIFSLFNAKSLDFRFGV